jgi:hypothetical protein
MRKYIKNYIFFFSLRKTCSIIIEINAVCVGLFVLFSSVPPAASTMRPSAQQPALRNMSPNHPLPLLLLLDLILLEKTRVSLFPLVETRDRERALSQAPPHFPYSQSPHNLCHSVYSRYDTQNDDDLLRVVQSMRSYNLKELQIVPGSSCGHPSVELFCPISFIIFQLTAALGTLILWGGGRRKTRG